MELDRIDAYKLTRVKHIGAWRMDTDADKQGGNAFVGKEAGASLIFSIYGKDIYLHVFKGPTLGSFSINIDGNNIETTDLQDVGVLEDYETVIKVTGTFAEIPHLVTLTVVSPSVIIDSIYGV